MAFLAVLSALWAPVSMLAQEVRTGQLGGICSAGSATAVWHVDDASSSTNPDGAPGQSASHCEMCGALGWALPPLALSVPPSFAGQQVAAQDVPAALAPAVTGLPFSRGPPSA